MAGSTRKFVLTGLMTSLVLVLTFILPVPVPYTSGYIHLGDSMIYISVIILGPVYGAFASGVGSMLADLLAGYAQYAIPTLVIKSLMAMIMGLILSGRTKKASFCSAGAAVAVWFVFTAGSVVYLKSMVSSKGIDALVSIIAGEKAAEEAAANAARMVNNLPVYLSVSLAILIAVLSLIAWFITKKDGYKAFTLRAVIGMSAAGMCMVLGYFTVESFMYSPIAALMSVPMNMIQFFAGVVTASLLAPVAGKFKIKE